MKKYIVLAGLFLLLLLPGLVKCQPGYQGRKVQVKYAALISPAWKNANYNSEASFFTYNISHTLALTRVMTRRSMLGLKGSIARTSVPYELVLNGKNLYEGKVSPIKSTVYSGGIEYYLFRKKAGNLAPLGSYFMVECNFLWVSLYDSKYKQSIGGFNKVGGGVWLGQQKIYYDRILLDVAIGSQLLFLSAKEYGGYSPDDLTLKDHVGMRLLQRNLMNLKVGVGYLF